MLPDIEYHRHSHTDWEHRFSGTCEVCGEKFSSRAMLETHQYSDHPEILSVGFALLEYKCTYCEAVFTREDSRNRHHKLCKKNPDAKRLERKKNVKRGTRVDSYSFITQPPVPSNGLGTYLQLTELDAPQLPRLDPESPTVVRGEIYCRYPGCSVTARHRHPSALREHYKIKHDIEFEAFKTSIGPVGRKQHEAYKSWLAQYAQLGQENVGPAPPRPTIW
ncbi:hypothetical protein N7536_005043 [Penicillium majusculum]|nr:hypothetical protein N7536_005043 [Penicillium majusculum]